MKNDNKEVAVSPSRPLICSACVEMRECFPEHHFCSGCVKSQPEINLSWQEKWLRHLDNCEMPDRGKGCDCADGKFLFSRASNEKLRIEMRELGIEIPSVPKRGN